VGVACIRYREELAFFLLAQDGFVILGFDLVLLLFDDLLVLVELVHLLFEETHFVVDFHFGVD